ncbi:MAG: glycosyltransferase family 1 protein [Synergistaceae bacterium]|nr:glycosyltransferase family 1 protein [Synergistaceae bacterium]
MRVAIDLQGAQSDSRYRGIGRYSLSLARAIAENCGEHEITIVLSGLFPDSIEPLKGIFKDVLPEENIRVWDAPGPVYEFDTANIWRRKTAELLREAFYESLDPDVVFISSFMEGFAVNSVTSIGRFSTNVTTAVTLYDLIPLVNPGEYLTHSKLFKDHYMRKIEDLKEADGFLSISEYSAMEGIKELDLEKSRVVNVSSACDDVFQKLTKGGSNTFNQYGIIKPFVMYTGGADSRKNLSNLISAYSRLPEHLKNSHQIVIVGKLRTTQIKYLKLTAMSLGLDQNDVIFTGYVSDSILVELYNSCELFVFPSWHEGFGLPVLEAINCGAPVIASNTSSLPEVIGISDALFDPFDPDCISDKMQRALTDIHFRKTLIDRQSEHAKNFDWNISAKRAISFFEKIAKGKKGTLLTERSAVIERLISKIAAISEGLPSDSDLRSVAAAIAHNHPKIEEKSPGHE